MKPWLPLAALLLSFAQADGEQAIMIIASVGQIFWMISVYVGSFLILVFLDFPQSRDLDEDESINLKSLPTPVSETQQGPMTRNPISDSGSYQLPPLAHCPNPSSTIITVRFKLTLFTVQIPSSPQ